MMTQVLETHATQFHKAQINAVPVLFLLLVLEKLIITI
jgi:hypothetical protein